MFTFAIMCLLLYLLICDKPFQKQRNILKDQLNLALTAIFIKYEPKMWSFVNEKSPM